MNKIKVIIVDDHKVFRKGLAIVIEDSKLAIVVDECHSGEDFLEKILNTDCDLVFMDINLPGISGFEATLKALEIKNNFKIIAMSANDDIGSVNKMLNSGASGYLGKDVDYEDIHKAISNVIKGTNYFSNNILIKLSNNISQSNKNNENEILKLNLTKRELEVLELICKGYNNYQIAEKLFIAERTVEKHKANLYVKTDTDNALNLALFAFKKNIIQN